MNRVRKLSYLSLAVFVSQSVFARTINVADHGVVPGTDVSKQVNALIDSLKEESGVTLLFPKGQYDFYPETAVERYRAVTNHDNSLKRLAFPLFGHKDLTIDGGGSTFMFHGRICPITLDGTEGITLKNFTIDWDTPFHHEITVVKSEPEDNSFVARITPDKYGYEIREGKLYLNHYNWQDEIGQNVAFDPKTEAPYFMTKNYALSRKRGKMSHAGEGLVRFTGATKVAPPVGAVLTTYGNGPTNRLAQAIHLSNGAKDTYIENVTVYAAGGMALIAERAENVHLNGFVVTSTEERSLATRADATHFLGCKGLIKLENCRLEHMADDGINVHGAYIKINEYLGEKVFLCEISHRQQLGLTFAEPGDRVMITSRETILPIYETVVTGVEVIDEALLRITVAEVPSELPKGLLSMENLTWYPDVTLRQNIMRNNRARSALISTKGKVLIEDNFFSSQMHGILIEGDNNSWYESGGVRDITINNNTFENIGYGNGQSYPLYAAPLLRPEQHIGDEQYHFNIRFTNNRIKSFNGLLVHAFNVDGLTVTGNTVELSEDYPTLAELPTVELDYCEDVRITDNTFIGFGRELAAIVSENSREVSIKENVGLMEVSK